MNPQPANLRRNAIFQRTPALGASPHEVLASESNPLQKIGYWFLIGYLFVALSRVLDVTTSQLRLPAVLYGGLILMALLSGQFFKIFRSEVGWAMVLLFSWCTLTIPFSTWKGGSTQQYEEVAKAFFLGVAIIAIPRTSKDTIRLLHVTAAAILGAAILSYFYGRIDYGRVSMIVGTYSDPNMYAMTLLMAIPLWVSLAWQVQVSNRLPVLLCILPILFTFLRTGSRGAFFGFGAVLAFTFFVVPFGKKVILLITAISLVGISVAILPTYILARYLTVFTAQDTYTTGFTQEEAQQLYMADVGSSQARIGLLIDSLQITMEHPLFGVGLGQFPTYNWERKTKQGVQGANHSAVPTHNVYTQFSSEAGIPALLFFIALLYMCFRASAKIGKLAPDLAIPAQGLRVSLVALAACGFFLAVAYSQLFYIMGAITAKLYMLAMEQNQQRAQAPVAVPVQRPRPPVFAPLVPVLQPVAQRQTPRSRLSPFRTSSKSVRNAPLS